MARHRTTLTTDSVAEESRKSLHLSTLFSTMLESNAMLREEIDHMQGGESRVTAEQQQQHTYTVPMNATVSYQERPMQATGPRQLHSQSLPPRLLEASAVTASRESLSCSTVSVDSSSQDLESLDSVDGAHTDSSVSGDEASSGDAEELEGDCDLVRSEGDLIALQPLHHHHHHHYHRSNGGYLCGEALPPPLSITSVSSTELSPGSQSELESDPYASPGGSTIETMWDNFSVEEYAPPIKHREKRVKVQEESRPVQKTWSRRITIPEPFSMTVREEGKPKRKSRALIAAEQEKLKRKVQEDLECQKQFRALPVPATTYVPIDELMEEEKQTEFRCDRDVPSIKPFNFMKREEEKQRQKRECEALNSKRSSNKLFKAKPIPHNILSPRVSELLREKEEYRKILIRVRSQDILARAELPRSMQQRHREYAMGMKKKLGDKQSEAFVTKEHTFHPSITPAVPDHDQLYCQFQQQLDLIKEVRPPTTPQPFVLRTSSVPLRRSCLQEELEQTSMPTHTTSRTTSPYRTGVQSSRSIHSQPPMYDVQMTEAARLRQSANERKIAKKEEEAAKRHRKNTQQRELHTRVAQQVQLNDHTTWLRDKQREKMQELRFVCNIILLHASSYTCACSLVVKSNTLTI